MSFNIAMSGLQSITEQLTSISNNIANAGTYGYKAQRANFSSMYAGTQATGTQIGSTTQNIGLTGGVLSTGRALDASINGRGFFVSKTVRARRCTAVSASSRRTVPTSWWTAPAAACRATS
jgi:flagellar hook protein FlgE